MGMHEFVMLVAAFCLLRHAIQYVVPFASSFVQFDRFLEKAEGYVLLHI